jgi:hypothetical protein
LNQPFRCRFPGGKRLLLEFIAGGGLRIETESGRPHHEDRPGTLGFLGGLNYGLHGNAL